MPAPELNTGTMRPSDGTAPRRTVGFAFPFRKENGEFPKRVYDIECVQDDYLMCFRRPRRSMIMRPRQGTLSQTLVFESAGALLDVRIQREIRQTTLSDEPRVKVLGVRVAQNATESQASIAYEVQGVRDVAQVDFEKP